MRNFKSFARAAQLTGEAFYKGQQGSSGAAVNANVVAGTPLTDTATQTALVAQGLWRTLPVLSQGGTLTLSTTGAVAGMKWTITRTATGAFTYAIVNGGVGAGTLFTMPSAKINFVDVVFDGTNWVLQRMGVN